MSDQTLGRREVLLGAGVAAGGVVATSVGLAAPAAARAQHDDERVTLNGSWLVTRQDDGDPTMTQAVVSFADGNVFVEHDIRPAGPPFTGTWAGGYGKRFRATFWSGFPGDQGPGSPGVTVRVRLEGGVRRGMLSGTYVVAVFDPTGAEIEAATGTFFDGQPIEA